MTNSVPAANQSKKKRIYGVTIIGFIVFILAAVFCLFPLYAMLVASFKPGSYLVRYGLNIDWDFSIMSLDNYIYLFTDGNNYFTWYKNSLILTLLQVGLCLFTTSMVGYGFAKYRFKGRNLLFTLVMVVMMVPIEVMLLGYYQLFTKMQIMNTYWAAMLPFVVAPTAIFFFQQYVSGISSEFMEAARIDGCTEYGIYFRIYMPLMLPSFAAMMILQCMNCWNNFLWPMMALRSSELQTLPIGLRTLLTPYGNNYDMLIAGSVLMVLPIMIVYVFFQRYFIEGMTAGGVKG